MFLSLDQKEKMQLTDYIIKSYNCVDYEAVVDYFGGYSDMVAAINTTKGSEYAIKEDFISGSDRIYMKMTNYLLGSGVIASIDSLLRLPLEKRRELMDALAIYTGAGKKKVARYLHINLEDIALMDN